MQGHERLIRVGVGVGIRAAVTRQLWQRRAVAGVTQQLITDDAGGIRCGVVTQAHYA